MAKGITITVTRVLETRDRRHGERGHRIWTGLKWVSVDSMPLPIMSIIKDWDRSPRVISTRIAFPAAGTVTIDALRYRAGLMKRMQKLGVVQ